MRDQRVVKWRDDKAEKEFDHFTKTKKMMTRNNITLSAEMISFRRKLSKLRKHLDQEGKPSELTRKLMNFLNKEIKNFIKRDIDRASSSKIEAIWDEKDPAKAWHQLKDVEPDIGKCKEDSSKTGIEDKHSNLQKDEASVAQIHEDAPKNKPVRISR